MLRWAALVLLAFVIALVLLELAAQHALKP